VTVTLRSFEEKDRDSVVALSRHALARLEEQLGAPLWVSRNDLDTELAAWDGAPAETLRVVEEDREVAAFGGVRVQSQATLVGPLVAKRFRGQKMGTALLDASIELACEHGVEWMLAEVGPHNFGGRLLLEHKGFRPRNGLDAVYRLRPADHRPAGDAPPGIDVRRGAGADTERVYSLYLESFPSGRRTEEIWRRWLEEGEILVAQRGGTVVAFVHLEPASRWISHVDVAEEERGLGVGGYLFSQAVEEYWNEHPGEELRLTVAPYDTPAIRLYRRLGFAPWLLLERYELKLT
jgi:ribosomal protein S18 acetylase RimI-like enzyme